MRNLDRIAALAALLPVWLMLLSAAASAQATRTLDEHLTQRWFVTEVVVFVRQDVMDFAVDEDLVRYDGASFPRSLRSFHEPDDGFGRGYLLDPVTPPLTTAPQLEPFEDQPERQTPADDVDRELGDAALASGEPLPPPEIAPTLEPDPLLEFLQAVAEYERELEAQSYRWLDPNTFTLTNEANRLDRTRGYRVLLHGRWLQPVPERQSPQALLVQAGPRYGNAYGLEGSFDLTVSRFLHFRADLYYREPLLGSRPIDRPKPPRSIAAGATPGAAYPSLQDLSTDGFMQLRESRRMRGGDLHYLDHPKLGVLVRVEPVAHPETLSAGHPGLEESAQ